MPYARNPKSAFLNTHHWYPYAISAEWLARQGRREEALAQIDRAVALGPNEADIHVSRARILNAAGWAEEAEKAVRQAMRLNPHCGLDYLRVLGQSLLHQERYAEAAEFVERAVNRQPELSQNYVTLAIIYGHLGRAKDASAAVKKYNEIVTKRAADFPPLTVQRSPTGGTGRFSRMTRFIAND